MCWGSALLTVEAKRPCWERNAPLIRLDARGTGGEGSGGDVLCDAERGDNEACLSLPHIPPSQHFHAISAICCPDCALSTVPMTNWLAARPLSSGLSLWISMCSSSTPVFVFFISFPYSLSLSKSRQSPHSQVKTPRGAFADQLMTFTKGQRNGDYSSGPWWASSSSSSGQIMAVPWHL